MKLPNCGSEDKAIERPRIPHHGEAREDPSQKPYPYEI